MKLTFLAAAVAGLIAISTQVQQKDDSSQPVELGTVEWVRDLDSAVATSREKDKPIAILFQEVPG